MDNINTFYYLYYTANMLWLASAIGYAVLHAKEVKDIVKTDRSYRLWTDPTTWYEILFIPVVKTSVVL